jgi:hypothetical protein
MPLLSSHLLLRSYSLSILTIAFYLIYNPSPLLTATSIWLVGEAMSVRPAAFAVPADNSEAAGQLLLGARQRAAATAASGGGGGGGTGVVGALNTASITITQPEKEIFALMAVVVGVYAVMQFVFAGDLTLLSSSHTSTGTRDRDDPSSSEVRKQKRSSSRYAEDLHTLLTAQSRWLILAGLRVLGSAGLVGWIYLFHSKGRGTSPVGGPVGMGLLANRVTFSLGMVDMLFWGYLWTVLKEEGRMAAGGLARWREGEDETDD